MESQNLNVPPDRPYHSKRPHRKSRAGCRTCKTRKVKCDEGRPVCRNCTLRKAKCIYLDQQPPATSSSSSASPPPLAAAVSTASGSTTSRTSSDSSRSTASEKTPEPSSPVIKPSSPSVAQPDSKVGLGWFVANCDISIVVKEPMFRPPDVSIADMKLMWWYTSNTYSSFRPDKGWPGSTSSDDILKIIIPQRAFETPFLMHVLLALTATHLHALGQDMDTKRLLTYRARAFEGYRNGVANPTPDLYPALLASSLILAVVASHMFREEEPRDLYVLDWMLLWRGISLIINMIKPKALWESGMAELFYRPPMDLIEAVDHIPDYLIGLVEAIPPDHPEHKYREAYMRSLTYLATLYQELSRSGMSPIMTLRICTWFTFLPKSFIRLARQRRAIPLVILAHYLVFVKMPHNIWWTVGIGDREIPAVGRALGCLPPLSSSSSSSSSMGGGGDGAAVPTPTTSSLVTEAMQIPLAAVGIQDRDLLGRMLLRDPGWRNAWADNSNWAQGRPLSLRKALGFVDDLGRLHDPNTDWTVDMDGENKSGWNDDFRDAWRTTLVDRGRVIRSDDFQDPELLEQA